MVQHIDQEMISIYLFIIITKFLAFIFMVLPKEKKNLLLDNDNKRRKKNFYKITIKHSFKLMIY